MTHRAPLHTPEKPWRPSDGPHRPIQPTPDTPVTEPGTVGPAAEPSLTQEDTNRG